jgi:hypothetical protein
VYVSYLTIDKNDAIKDAATRFFGEIVSCGTVLLNNMSDIIFKLYEQNASHGDIKKILVFLLKILGQNKRHLGQIIDKFCGW